MTDHAKAAVSPDSDLLSSVVGRSVSRLQAQALGQHGDGLRQEARTILSILRRDVGKEPEQVPLAWERALGTLNPALPERMRGHGDSASPSERAAFHAIMLFALHMQSAEAPVHRLRVSFGSAARMLVASGDSKSLAPRFEALLAARSQASRMQHLRSLVTLMRSRGIGFDYGIFAEDLRSLASISTTDPGRAASRRQGVLLRWGRDFVTAPKHQDDQTTTPTN